MAEKDGKLQEMLLCAFSNTLEGNNLFVRNIPSRRTPGGTAPAGVFARHDYQPKMTICEQNVWGTESGNNTFLSRMGMLEKGIEFRKNWPEGLDSDSLDPFEDTVAADIRAESSDCLSIESSGSPDIVVTGVPPKLIIFNGFLVGAGAQHCQGQIRQRDRFATTMTIPTRNGDFGATRAGSEWPAPRAHSTACPNA